MAVVDPNPALRAQIIQALADIETQIRGLEDLTRVSISPELLLVVQSELATRNQRRDLLRAVLAALDAVVKALEDLEKLAGAGFPPLPPVTLPPGLFDELQGEETDLDAAVAIFVEAPLPASKVTIDLGTAQPKA